MATTFSQLYDVFMTTVTDYTLITLYNTSVPNFETYMSAFLLKAITDFDVCDQDLSYDLTAPASFTADLTQRNIDILVLLMKKHWLEKLIDDIKQMNLAVTDRDYKRYAESQNMKAKQDRYNMEKEEISQKLSDYILKYTINWSDWLSGTFFVP